jgi:hypothetical protein
MQPACLFILVLVAVVAAAVVVVVVAAVAAVVVVVVVEAVMGRVYDVTQAVCRLSLGTKAS